MSGAPRVSIPMVTYCHERWLGQAIESVLAQDFDDWELVIADDLSTDRTVDVALEYAERDGRNRIRVLPHGEKFGPRQNYMRAVRACRGEFVSQLDGDDFFTDTAKLSKQVAFLDAHPECSGVFGSWLETDQEGENGVLTEGFGLDGRDRFEAVDFGPYCVTTSVVVMFRKGLFGEYPEWYTDVDVGDWPLHLLNTMHGGPYAFIDGVFAAHRNHGAGVWTNRSDANKAASTVRTHDLFLRELPKELGDRMLKGMLGSNFGRARGAHRAGDDEAAAVFLGWCEAHAEAAGAGLKTRWKIRRLRGKIGAQAS